MRVKFTLTLAPPLQNLRPGNSVLSAVGTIAIVTLLLKMDIVSAIGTGTVNNDPAASAGGVPAVRAGILLVASA